LHTLEKETTEMVTILIIAGVTCSNSSCRNYDTPTCTCIPKECEWI